MTAPNAFFVDLNSTPVPGIGVAVDPATGVPTMLTKNSVGTQIATLVVGGGGTVATNWQTYTPSATNTVHIAIDRALGPNVMLGAPVDNTQVIDAPLNMADGQEMQINLVGGGGSGSWSAFTFFGAAPTADASASNYTAVYVKRRGTVYEATIGATRPV